MSDPKSLADSFSVNSSLKKYHVSLKDGVPTLEGYDFYLIDAFFKDRFSHLSPVLWIPAEEETKSFSFSEFVFQSFCEHKIRKSSHVAVIGGGVAQEIGSFCASLYQRGIRWTFFPTTILSMVDSCLGGKNSLNFAHVKNLLGTFYPPENIHIHLSFMASLPRHEIEGGLFEVTKIAYVSGKFTEYLSHYEAYEKTGLVSKDLVRFSLLLKKDIIERDEFDCHERQLLNFGHTFGHALEIASDYKIPHGWAVGWGMKMAFLWKDSYYDRAFGDHVNYRLRESSLESVDPDRFLAAFSLDKKHTPEAWRIILPRDSAGVECVDQLKDKTRLLEVLRSAHMR